MPLQENELARREGTAVVVRALPLRVRWELDGLSTSDDNDLRCTFVASIGAVENALDRRMFVEVLLAGRNTVTGQDLSAHFAHALQAAASRAAAQSSAAAWVDGDAAARRSLIEAMVAAARPVAFACGVELLAPFDVEFQSISYQQQRLRAVQQSMLEKHAAGELEQLQRATHLLREFQELRKAAPELSAGKVLEQISPTDRGSMLRTLLMAGAQERRKPSLWAVAGPYLVRIESSERSARPELTALPPTLGPLRSVQSTNLDGQTRLLVGAQSGVIILREDALADPKIYRVPGLQSSLGFNQVIFVASSRSVFATHGEAGVVCWDADRPDSPRSVLPPARFGVQARVSSNSSVAASMAMSMNSDSSGILGGPVALPAGPRNLQPLPDGSVLFSVGHRLFRWDGATLHPVPSDLSDEVVSIVANDARSLIVVFENGTIRLIDRGSTGRELATQRRGVRVRAAAALPWLDGMRLLLATEGGPVQCIGLEDGLVTEYLSPYRSLRMVCGSAASVAAVSTDRQRLILWDSWDGRQPAAELYLTGLTRHRIADVDFG